VAEFERLLQQREELAVAKAAQAAQAA